MAMPRLSDAYRMHIFELILYNSNDFTSSIKLYHWHGVNNKNFKSEHSPSTLMLKKCNADLKSATRSPLGQACLSKI